MNTQKQRGQGYISRQYMMEMLPRHAKFNPIWLEQLVKIPEEILQNRASEWAAKLYRLSRQVGKEFNRTRSFTRTHLNAHGILWGIINIEHKVEDMVLDFFHQRFPRYIVILYNQNTKISHICNEKGNIEEKSTPIQNLIAQLEKERPVFEIIPGEKINGEKLSQENQELYRVFYESQYIADRKNPRYFQQMMPKKWQAAPGMEMEKRFLNTSLTKYIGEKIDKKAKTNNPN
jgi:probable DNA metabolism protein